MRKDGDNPQDSLHVSKYKQLMDYIIRNIQNGILQDGSPLPSESALSTEMNMSRVTVRQALAQLCESGIILKQQGRRSIVNASALYGRKRTLRYGWISRDPFVGTTPIYLEIYIRLQRAIMGINAQLVFLPMLSPQEDNWILSILDSFDGIFLAGIKASVLTQEFDKRLRSMPNVIEIDDIGDSPAVYNICTDNYAAGRMAAEYLIENNRNVMVCMNKTADSYQAFSERAQGIIDYYAEKKISLTIFNCHAKDIGTEKGNTAILDILKENPQIDTVWHAMDSIAIKIRRNLQDIAPRDPGYYRSAGTDGISSILENEEFHVSLQQPVEEIARQSFQTMINFSSGQRPETYLRQIPPVLLPWKYTELDNKADAV